jgi:hypothetical protein
MWNQDTESHQFFPADLPFDISALSAFSIDASLGMF